MAPRTRPVIGVRSRARLGALGALAIFALAGVGTLAQPSPIRLSHREERPRARPGTDGDFHFVRVEYDSDGGNDEAYYFYDGRLWQRWETDYPQADQNFLSRLGELTTAIPDATSLTRRLTAPDLFSYPFLYFSDVGWMDLTETEARRLREYLLKGGFLWVDDFWGLAEWSNFEREMRKVLPEIPWREIPNDHQILHTLFPLTELPQVPARDFAEMGWTHDPPNIHRYPAYGVDQAHLRGYFADDGRLLAVATLNTDLGDGFEREAYGQWYFETYSTVAYAAGVNIVLYSLLH